MFAKQSGIGKKKSGITRHSYFTESRTIIFKDLSSVEYTCQLTL